MPATMTHRICLESWELLQVFRGPTIPREGKSLILEKDGQEKKYRVATVLYKLASSGELMATIFVAPA
ncbi:hypothetical protein [Polyangium aurulentum]|uniref:hypothetical protein n=1 Tax=Polyangium aurulentum TaxID=2567896 RepID=UPI0010AEBEFC|nr:hypothetical protein [Polyangium aurulentum]UQA56868.1 hypothetical protein E8A73_037055 [Polyangium aurulentum]